ncbi:unnamed protein product [Closterium sp. NIES-54]
MLASARNSLVVRIGFSNQFVLPFSATTAHPSRFQYPHPTHPPSPLPIPVTPQAHPVPLPLPFPRPPVHSPSTHLLQLSNRLWESAQRRCAQPHPLSIYPHAHVRPPSPLSFSLSHPCPTPVPPPHTPSPAL